LTAGPFVALDHGIVAVRDLDAASDTYAKLLGRAPSWRGAHPGWGTANALFRLENTYLELVAPSGDGPFGAQLRGHLEASGEGLLGFALATPDAAACASELRARGLAVAEPIDGSGRDDAGGAERRWRNVMLPREATRGVFVFGIEHRSPPDALPLVAPADPRASIGGIDHVVVRTDAPEAAIRFYRDQLGLRLALDKTFEQWGARLLFFRVGGVTVEIAAPAKPAENPAGADACWGISWRVPDVDAARERLLAAGFDVSELRTGRRPDTRVCTVRAPTCGVATLLIEAAPRERPGSR
jgi:catechol 2,3-dioxygenase-like lactoylglutathione lyase family enzyme